jgi:hypothetical protein
MTEVLVEENLFAHCAYIAPLAPPASATQSDAANVSQCPDCIRVKTPRLDASRTPTAVCPVNRRRITAPQVAHFPSGVLSSFRAA